MVGRGRRRAGRRGDEDSREERLPRPRLYRPTLMVAPRVRVEVEAVIRRRGQMSQHRTPRLWLPRLGQRRRGRRGVKDGRRKK